MVPAAAKEVSSDFGCLLMKGNERRIGPAVGGPATTSWRNPAIVVLAVVVISRVLMS